MHPRTKVRNAAVQIRDKLIPLMPIRDRGGKKYKVLPVVYIHHFPPNEPIIYWAIPEGTKLTVEIPNKINGVSIKQKPWGEPAPIEEQAMALKVFPA